MTSRREPKRERPGVTRALRSLCRPSAKSALTHHPQAGGGMAFGHRAPSGVWLRHQLSPASIYSRRQRRLVHRTQPRRSPGAWGPLATNKRHRVYTGALLATMVTPPQKKGGDRPMRRPTPKLQWEGTGLTRHCLSYPRSFWQTVSRPSHCGVRFAQVEKRTTTHTRVTKQAEWQWAAAGAG